MTQALTPQAAYDKLAYYTLAHQSPDFIHQYIVDAFAAQTASEDTKPIKLFFALIGLYLHLEQGFTGKQVQKTHAQLGKIKQIWPTFTLPSYRGDITVFDVLDTPVGPIRDQLINDWSQSVWNAWSASHGQVASWLKAQGFAV